MCPGGVEGPTAGLSQQVGVAEGSPVLEVQCWAGSSPDNDGTGRYRQTARVWQARRRGVTRVNQWLNPLKRGTGSNLADMGRAAAGADRWMGKRGPEAASNVDSVRHGECLRRTRVEAAGEELGADPADWHMVNAGTVSVSPVLASIQESGGQAHRQLMVPERDGGPVVVRGRESRSHGEGAQRVRSDGAGMSGVRR